MLKIIEKKKIWFSISIIIMLIGLGFAIVRGMNFGIDFVGGTKVVLSLNEGYDKEEVDSITKKYADDVVTNTSNDTEYEIRSSSLDSQGVNDLVDELKEKYSLGDDILVSQDEIGASVGNELKRNAVTSLAIAFVAMLIYIAIRFEWSFGFAALIALFHDIFITTSFYVIFDVQINTPFIAAILTLVGYSINDTIVVFDRIRENRKKLRGKTEAEIANISITETLTRSINTSLTTLITISAVGVFVPAVRDFAVPLMVGIASGTCSSIFIASPIWVMIKNGQDKKKKNGKSKEKIATAN